MRRHAGWLAWTLVAAGVLLGSGPPLQAAASPLVGNWKVVLLSRGQEISLWLVKLEDKEGKLHATFLSAGHPDFTDSEVEKFSADSKAVHITFKADDESFSVTGYLPRGEKAPKKLLGSVSQGGGYGFARLERTDAKKLVADPKQSVVPGPGANDFAKAMKEKDAARVKAFKAIQEKYPTEPISYTAGLMQLRSLTSTEAKEGDIRAVADKAVKLCALYGPDMETQALRQLGRLLAGSKAGAAVAIGYLRRLEKQLPESAPAGNRLAVLKVLVKALTTAGKTDEVKAAYSQVARYTRQLLEELDTDASLFERAPILNALALALRNSDKEAEAKTVYGDLIKKAREAEKELGDNPKPAQRLPILKVLAAAYRDAGKGGKAANLEGKITQIETDLDKEFHQKGLPFKPAAFGGRTVMSDRVAVVELFTGAQCPPCVAADLAFDALLKVYKPSDVIALQYHLHIPGPDPLTNPDTETRSNFYRDEIRGTPTIFLNGKLGPSLGGRRQDAEDRYEDLTKAVDKQLEEPSKAKLTLKASRKGDNIDIMAEVSDLKKTKEDVRLLFVLVEEVAHYGGGNGQRLHHHVVRAFPGGQKGIALTKKSAKGTASVDLKTLKKSLAEYLTENEFGRYDQPLELKNLKVVALIQDVASKEILQAAQVKVPEVK